MHHTPVKTAGRFAGMGLGTVPWGSLGQRHVPTPFPKILPCWAPSIPPQLPPNTLCWTWDFPSPFPQISGISGISKQGSSVVEGAVRASAVLLLKATQGLHCRGLKYAEIKNCWPRSWGCLGGDRNLAEDPVE